LAVSHAAPSTANRPVAARRLAAAASHTLYDVLTGPPVVAQLLAAYARALYLRTGPAAAGDVVAIVTADALLLPCSVVLPTWGDVPEQVVRAFATEVAIGGGLITGRGLDIAVSRWWRPRVPRHGTSVDHLPEAVAALAMRLPALPDELRRRVGTLADALLASAPDAGGAAGRALLGLGPGLTPAGDDVLAGLLLTLTTAHEPARQVGHALARAVLPAAPAGTTALSATLLRHASRGEGLPPALDFADALLAAPLDGAATREALDQLVRVGSSSGAALAHGVLLGVRVISNPLGTGRADLEVA